MCLHDAFLFHSLIFDMQHDHILKKVSFYLLTKPPGSGVGVGGVCG